jgi:hypothetical protein
MDAIIGTIGLMKEELEKNLERGVDYLKEVNI